METPVHKHDCDCCQYLGTKEYVFNVLKPAVPVDLYVCKEIGATNIIGRYGVDGDYVSYLGHAMQQANNRNKNPNATNLEKLTHYIETWNEHNDSLSAIILAEGAVRAIQQNIINDDLSFVKPTNKLKP